MNRYKAILFYVCLTLTHNLYANEKTIYDCTIDNIYTMGTGKSSDEEVGQLRVTMTGNTVEINSNVELVESGNLRLLVNTDIEIVAINPTMQFSYAVHSNEFSFTTGNGHSEFKSGEGHVGNQMRVSGFCKLNSEENTAND